MQNYGELKAAIANWSERTDDAANIPDFVRLAEGDIYRDLRCRQNEFHAVFEKTKWTLNGVTIGAWTTGFFKTLPQNYKEMKLVTWNGVPLTERSEQNLRARLINTVDAEVRNYAEVARVLIFSEDIPDDPTEWGDGDTLTYTYYGVESLNSFPTWQTAANPVDNPAVEDTQPENISQTDQNTTRLLQHYPDVYLAGSLMWAHRYHREAAKAAEWKAIFDEARALLDAESEELTGSTVQVTGIYGDGYG